MDHAPDTLDQLKAALAAGERHLPGLHLEGLDGLDLDLSGCDLQGSCFKEARFGHARLCGARVQGSSFQRALLWGADLSDLQAQQSFWHEADLSASRLQGAFFDGALLHRSCLRGVVAAGSCWRRARLVEVDFRSGLDQLTDLGSTDFENADLSFADLEGANLHGANLRDSCLYGVNLRRCDLRQADLRHCDLRDAQLEGLCLTRPGWRVPGGPQTSCLATDWIAAEAVVLANRLLCADDKLDRRPNVIDMMEVCLRVNVSTMELSVRVDLMISHLDVEETRGSHPGDWLWSHSILSLLTGFLLLFEHILMELNPGDNGRQALSRIQGLFRGGTAGR